MLAHITQDFMLIEEDNFTVSDAGQQHMAEGGFTKAQFLTCLSQVSYTREKSPITRLFSIIDLPFQKEGSQLCGLKLLWEMEKCMYVDMFENDAVWGMTLCPPGSLTDLHYDHWGPISNNHPKFATKLNTAVTSHSRAHFSDNFKPKNSKITKVYGPMSSYRNELHSERIRNRTDRIELNDHMMHCDV